MSFLAINIGLNLLNKIFTNSFERIGNKLIGLYEITSFNFFQVCHFYLGYFSLIWKIFDSYALKIIEKSFKHFIGNSLSIFKFIRSNPGAFFTGISLRIN